MNFFNKKGGNLNCIGLQCYEKDGYESEFKEMCPDIDIYPTIVSHKERVIAIGDIHGDMNLAINFLKAAKVIEEINNPERLFKYQIKERVYRLKINKINNSISGVDIDNVDKTYDQTKDHLKNQFDVIYRYYKIDNEYYVKIVQEDNNPKYRYNNCTQNCDFNRWFKWIGGETHVVQVGDQIDRCRPFDGNSCKNNITINDEDSDLEIMLFYDSLDRIAKKKGGRVFSLLGNHEIMNVTGDTRYVSYKGMREYSPEPKDVNRGEQIRIGKFETVIAKKLACTRSTILVIGDYLFVHGGIANKLAYNYKLVDVNSIIRKFLHGSLNNNSDLKTILNSSRYSPLWYRRLAYIPPDFFNGGKQHSDCKGIYDPIIKKINDMNFNQTNSFNSTNSSTILTEPTIQIKGMVIGHTPQFTVFNRGITTACGNRIIRTDIGASMAFDHFAKKANDVNNPDDPRHPQVMEILTNLQTKESTQRVLFYSGN
jgi:hypothetical protein